MEDSNRSRRAVLSSVVGVLAILAGCSVIGNGRDPSTGLSIVNQDNTKHAVVIEIMDGTRLVYSAGRIMESESNASIDAFNETGEYQVRVAVDGNLTENTFTFEKGAHLTIGINNDGNVTLSD